MRVQRKELLAPVRPPMRDDDMLAKVRRAFVDLTIEDAEDIVVRHECGLLAFKVGVRRAVGEDDASGLPRRYNIHRRDVATTMKTLSAVARPPGPAIIRIRASARKEVSGLIQEKMIGRGPGDAKCFLAWQGSELLIVWQRLHDQGV